MGRENGNGSLPCRPDQETAADRPSVLPRKGDTTSDPDRPAVPERREDKTHRRHTPATGRAIRLAPPSGSHEIPPSAPAPNAPVFAQEDGDNGARGQTDRSRFSADDPSHPIKSRSQIREAGGGQRIRTVRTPKTFRRTRPVRRSSKDTIAGTRTPASRQSLRGKTPLAKRRRTSIFFPTMKTAGDFPPHPVGFVSERPCRRTARTGAVARPAGKPANDRGSRRRPLPQASHPSPTSCASHDSFLRSRGEKSARQCSAAKQATSNRAKAADFGTERPKPGVYGMPQDGLGAGASAPVSSPADAGERNRDTNEKGEARILRRTRASPVRSVNVAGRPLRTPARPDYSISIISA